MTAAIDELCRQLRAAGTADRATTERAYLKSDLTHWGVNVGDARRIVRTYASSLDHAALSTMVAELWHEPVFERRRAAVELLRARTDLLDADDLPLVERLLRDSRTWALVDDLAERVAGPILEHDSRALSTVDSWASDGDFWLRRSALLALLDPLRRGEGDFDVFAGYADAMLEEKEFFIRKAIGWVLRDTGKRRPELVERWVRPRTGRISGVTIREAVKPLSPTVREELLAAYRQR